MNEAEAETLRMLIVEEALGRIRAIGGDTLVEQMVELFLEDVPRRLERLRSAVAANDRVAVARAAHSVRGSAATLGLETVARLCLEVETASKAGETQLRPSVAALAEAIALACEELRALIAAGVQG